MFGDPGGSQSDRVDVALPLVRTMNVFADGQRGRVPVVRIRGETESPYLKMAVAGTYDGQAWQLQDVADQHVFDELDLSETSSVVARQVLYPSSSEKDEAKLRQASVADDPAHLALSANISQRMKDLAAKITENISSPYEKVLQIETFLKIKYEYNPNFSEPPGNFEPNDWFLFESRQGVCSHFNSALVMLARAAGVPARLVVGYYVETGIASQTVYADQAHAWAEINLDGIGWTLFDATPGVFAGNL